MADMHPIMICSQELADAMGIPVGTIIGESEADRKYREWQERVAVLMRYDEDRTRETPNRPGGLGAE